VKTRQELEQQFTDAPAELIEYASQLQEEVRQQRDQLAQQEQELRRQQQLLAEARAHIAELKRQLFRPKADKLSPEQEEQLRQVAGDLQEQAQRPPPVSQEVLEPELPPQARKHSNSNLVGAGILCRRFNWKCSVWCSNPITRFAALVRNRDAKSARKLPPNTNTWPPSSSARRPSGPNTRMSARALPRQ